MNSLRAKQDSNQILTNDANIVTNRKKELYLLCDPFGLIFPSTRLKPTGCTCKKTNNKSVQKPHLMSLVSERFVRCKTTATVVISFMSSFKISNQCLNCTASKNYANRCFCNLLSIFKTMSWKFSS